MRIHCEEYTGYRSRQERLEHGQYLEDDGLSVLFPKLKSGRMARNVLTEPKVTGLSTKRKLASFPGSLPAFVVYCTMFHTVRDKNWGGATRLRRSCDVSKHT